jgi:anti-sigma regulatory factor (Ser/Thr protein kinase)
MTPMAPTRPTPITSPAVPARPVGPRVCRVRLTAGLAAAKAARAVVEKTLRAWRVPVDPDVAVLLTSELVTNAVTHGAEEAGIAGGFVTLAIACSAAGLRVDVHDGSGDLPLLESPLAEAETGRGLLLVTSLSAEWGFYRTPEGKAVYFTLEFLPDVHENVSDGSDDGVSRSVS